MKTINKLLLTGMLLSNLNSLPVYSNENVLYLNEIHKNDSISTSYNKGDIKTTFYFLGTLCVLGLAGFIYEKIRKKEN